LHKDDLHLFCRACGQEYPILDGIPTLMVDPAQDSALDLAVYEAENPADPVVRARTYAVYAETMARFGISGGACLELGSGTGNLTVGLVEGGDFDAVHCSDISGRFMRRIQETIRANAKLHYWLFDAGKIPFRTSSMTAVFGHSVLHHVLEYEAALAEVFRVLQPGGLAMFGEPVMDSHAMMSLCAGLIYEFEWRLRAGGLSDQDLHILRAIRNAYPSIGRRMRESRAELAGEEDKHIYIISDFLKLARCIGFQEAEYMNAFTPHEFGSDQQYRLVTTLERCGIAPEKLKPYDFIFHEMTHTFGAAMGAAAPANFGYFIMKKAGALM
jgi:ubiquinone/menaquinone biosynthesis C-methylase UbiE